MHLLKLLDELEVIDNDYYNSLLNLLKYKHYWPSIQVKRFRNHPNIVLLHNSYKNKDNILYKELFDECRSIIIDFSKDKPTILNRGIGITERLSDNEYFEIKHNDDIAELMYDGTNITMFYYENEWIVCTSTCTNVDHSKFAHPTKTHGTMLNETLRTLFPNTPDVRDYFTSKLNPELIYEFSLIHYQNGKYVDYTETYGDDYKIIVLNKAKKHDDETIVQCDLSNLGINNNTVFETPDKAIEYLQKEKRCYGILIKSHDGTYKKVSLKDIIFHEDNNFGNHNPWRNMIWIYQQNRDDFHINDYIKTYHNDIEFPLDNTGTHLDPTYIIHTVFSTIKDILHNLYVTTTQYYPKYNRFKMCKDIDKNLPPIIQFHLSQLRHKQITEYKNTKNIISINIVFHYLCNNNVKNIVSLINFFAIHGGYDIPPRACMCFSILNNLLI